MYEKHACARPCARTHMHASLFSFLQETQTQLHESQLNTAKTDGKLHAAQTRIVSLEKVW